MGSLLVWISFLIVIGRTSFEIGCNFNSNSRFFFSGYDNFLGLGVTAVVLTKFLKVSVKELLIWSMLFRLS